MNLRLRHPSGTSTVSIDADASLAQLKASIQTAASIPVDRQELRLGFPPALLPLDTSLDSTLASLGIKSGDSIIVAESSEPTPAVSAPPVRVVTNASSAPAASTVKSTSGAVTYEEVDGGYLVLRVVPDDNSCLFTAVGLVLEHARPNVSTFLRNLVADAIRSDPDTWSDPVLGQPRESYISTITRPNSWGGAIELSIFSKHYKQEICSIDVQTGRVDRFGQGEGYETSVMIVYSGIHYDALTFSYAIPTPTMTFPPPNLEFDTTVFPTSSDDMLATALKLVAKLRATHSYTDAATFTLKCDVCGKAIIGEKEAKSHAEETGHARFGEYDG